MLDAAGASSFPQTVSYSSVLGPKNLPFRVQGEFRTNGALTQIAGIVYHTGNDDHEANAGFKIVLTAGFSGSTGYKLGFIVSQHTSFYSSAESEQTGLDDGNWHSFEAIATPTTIQLIVDGVEGPLKEPSDERGVQTVKEFGRVETTTAYVLGQDPCCTNYGEQRILSGQIRNVALSWPLQSEVQDLKVEVKELKSRPATTQVVSGGRNSDFKTLQNLCSSNLMIQSMHHNS